MLERRVDRREALKIFALGLGTALFPSKVLGDEAVTFYVFYGHEAQSQGWFENLLYQQLVLNRFPIACKDIYNYILKGIKIWPEGTSPVCMTFDDGLRSQVDNVVPVLEKYKSRATFFPLLNYEDGVHRYFKEPEIKDLDNLGVEIGCHGFRHRPLPELIRKEGEAAAEYDVAESKKRMEEIVGHEVISWAYPYGRNGFSLDARRIVAKHYKIAFTTGGNFPNPNENNLFEIPRLSIS